jgi:hypothetical protein
LIGEIFDIDLPSLFSQKDERNIRGIERKGKLFKATMDERYGKGATV